MDFYEKNLMGVYVGDPYSYEFHLGAGYGNLSMIHEIICQATEIDGFNQGEYLLTVICQEDDTILGNTDFILHIKNVERTQTPSKYIRSTGRALPAIMAIDRNTFQYVLQVVPPKNEDQGSDKTQRFV